jgi:hypothetical protein
VAVAVEMVIFRHLLELEELVVEVMAVHKVHPEQMELAEQQILAQGAVVLVLEVLALVVRG